MTGVQTCALPIFPQPGTCVRLAGYPIEVITVEDNLVKTARISPALRKLQPSD